MAVVDDLGEDLRGREADGPDGPVYVLSGDLDMGSTGALTDRLLAYGAGRGHRVALDMADVGFIDSSGLRCLTRVFSELASFGGELRIVNASEAVLRVLRLVGVEEMFGLGSG